MKYVPDTTGRLRTRPHYDPIELDRDCERIVSEFMREKYGRVQFPIATDAIELLIEQYAQDLDLYADLEHLGGDVEGVTHFVPGQKPRVQILRRLSDDPRYENRLRTTLTHELGHAVYHAPLWNVDVMTVDLFQERPSAATIVCKRESIIGASQVDWMEWQAGYVCGAVLMPRMRVMALATDVLGKHLQRGSVEASSTGAAELIARVAGSFQVSVDAARVRLSKLEVITERRAGADLFALDS